MDSLIYFFLLFIYIGNYCYGATERVFMDNCSKAGFSCVTNPINKRHGVTYDCRNVADTTIYLWQFRSVGTIDSLTIKNCKILRLSFGCSGENKPIQSLQVINVENLIIIPSILTHNPPWIHFENISNINNIPRNTFSQIKRETYRPNCFVPLNDLQNITFSNVSIGVVETEAFRNLTDIKILTWDNVKVDRLQNNAMKIQMYENGDLFLRNNQFNILEPLTFRITANKMSVIRNSFNKLYASAFNGTIEYFDFNQNTINNTEGNAIEILAYHVTMNNNHFYYLHSGALQKISPGLLNDSKRNFASIKFVYFFDNNKIGYSDVGGVNPDYSAYKNVASNISLKNNLFTCSCKKLGWLKDSMNYQHGFENIIDFYEKLMNPVNSNNCAYTSCPISLKSVEKVCKSGDYNFEDFCKKKPQHTLLSGCTAKFFLRHLILISFLLLLSGNI